MLNEVCSLDYPFAGSISYGSCQLVSTPAYAKATAGKPFFFITSKTCLQSEALAKDWLGITPLKRRSFPEFDS
jgi:hypothetical protein